MHLFGILFPYINDDVRSKSHQKYIYVCVTYMYIFSSLFVSKLVWPEDGRARPKHVVIVNSIKIRSYDSSVSTDPTTHIYVKQNGDEKPEDCQVAILLGLLDVWRWNRGYAETFVTEHKTCAAYGPRGEKVSTTLRRKREISQIWCFMFSMNCLYTLFCVVICK